MIQAVTVRFWKAVLQEKRVPYNGFDNQCDKLILNKIVNAINAALNPSKEEGQDPIGVAPNQQKRGCKKCVFESSQEVFEDDDRMMLIMYQMPGNDDIKGIPPPPNSVPPCFYNLWDVPSGRRYGNGLVGACSS